MKTIRYAMYAILGIFLLLMALNNQQATQFVVLPDYIPGFPAIVFNVPLFIVILGALLIGIVIGYVLEYIRETRIRLNASRTQKALKKTTAELDALKNQTGIHDDEVLALLK